MFVILAHASLDLSIFKIIKLHFVFNVLVAPVPRPKIVANSDSTDQFNVIIGNFSTQYGPLR